MVVSVCVAKVCGHLDRVEILVCVVVSDVVWVQCLDGSSDQGVGSVQLLRVSSVLKCHDRVSVVRTCQDLGVCKPGTSGIPPA